MAVLFPGGLARLVPSVYTVPNPYFRWVSEVASRLASSARVVETKPCFFVTRAWVHMKTILRCLWQLLDQKSDERPLIIVDTPVTPCYIVWVTWISHIDMTISR
jgi:hypothetical protein